MNSQPDGAEPQRQRGPGVLKIGPRSARVGARKPRTFIGRAPSTSPAYGRTPSSAAIEPSREEVGLKLHGVRG